MTTCRRWMRHEACSLRCYTMVGVQPLRGDSIYMLRILPMISGVGSWRGEPVADAIFWPRPGCFTVGVLLWVSCKRHRGAPSVAGIQLGGHCSARLS